MVVVWVAIALIVCLAGCNVCMYYKLSKEIEYHREFACNEFNLIWDTLDDVRGTNIVQEEGVDDDVRN